MTNTEEDVLTFSDQSVGQCEECKFDGLVDVLLDTETNQAYWACPECGTGHRRGQRD